MISQITLYRCELCGKPTPAKELTWALVDDICRTCFEPWRRGHNSAIQAFNHRLRILRTADRKNRDNYHPKKYINRDVAQENCIELKISAVK